MKKFVVFSLVGLSILAFGAVGYSQQLYQMEKGKPGSPQPLYQPGNYAEAVVGEKPPVLEFRAAGFIDVIYEVNKNVPQCAPSPWTDFSGGYFFGANRIFAPMSGLAPIAAGGLTGALPGSAFDKQQAYWETRARLRFDAIMGKQASGTIIFEIDAARWGERNGLGAQRNQAGNWNADSAAVEVKNAYLTFALPPIIPVPVTINAGILAYATRPVLNYTDGSGINIAFRPGPAQIKFTWMKPLENQDWAADDADVYGLEAKVALGTMTVGGYLAAWNMNTYPLSGGGTVNMYGVFTPQAGGNSAYNATYINNQKANFYWWGLFADGKLGPVYVNTDLVYDYGYVIARNATVTNPAINSKVDYRGYIGRLAIDFPWEKFNFGVVGMYASGADLQKTDSTGRPGNRVGTSTPGGYLADGFSSKVNSYVISPNSEHVYDDEGLVIYGMGGNGLNRANTGYNYAGAPGGASVGAGAYGGTWFAKLYGNFKPAPWYRITIFGMYIGDTVKHGNKIGNSVTYAGGASFLLPKDDKDIGFEFDLINDFQIYKNLQLRVGGGYLIAGSAMQYRDQRLGAYPTPLTSNTNVTPSNPWAIATKLMYTW